MLLVSIMLHKLVLVLVLVFDDSSSLQSSPALTVVVWYYDVKYVASCFARIIGCTTLQVLQVQVQATQCCSIYYYRFYCFPNFVFQSISGVSSRPLSFSCDGTHLKVDQKICSRTDVSLELLNLKSTILNNLLMKYFPISVLIKFMLEWLYFVTSKNRSV